MQPFKRELQKYTNVNLVKARKHTMNTSWCICPAQMAKRQRTRGKFKIWKDGRSEQSGRDLGQNRASFQLITYWFPNLFLREPNT